MMQSEPDLILATYDAIKNLLHEKQSMNKVKTLFFFNVKRLLYNKDEYKH